MMTSELHARRQRYCHHEMVSQVGNRIDGGWVWTGWKCQYCSIRFEPKAE